MPTMMRHTETRKLSEQVSLMTAALNMLALTREVLREQGWCQHTGQNGEGRVCLAGALDIAWAKSTKDTKAKDHLRNQLDAEAYASRCETANYIDYNDAKGRTYKQVAAYLGRVEKFMEQQVARRRARIAELEERGSGVGPIETLSP